MSILWLLLLALFAVGAKGSDFSLAIIPKSIVVTFGETPSIRVEANGYLPVPIRVNLAQQKEVQVLPNETLTFSEGMHNDSVEVLLHPIRQGRFIIQPVIEPPRVVDGSRFFLLMKVAMYEPLIIVSLLIGWTYTACWSAGYYPQIWYNYRQKSVVGLSFDYLYINIVGHISYVIFNAFLYWNSYIEEEYYRRHPLGLNPVILNDIGFAAHAVFGTGFTILQCRWYYTGGNTVSKPAKVIIGLFLVLIVVSMSMAWLRYIHWLDFLYVLSYIKLLTTMVKYFPQAYMNYCRKSTTGFPILNRLMDLAGGLFGILQMIINAWNFDDWTSIGGDPVKFGLGIFSIVFDFVFMFQHYVLYRKSKPKPEQVNLPILQSHVKTITAEE